MPEEYDVDHRRFGCRRRHPGAPARAVRQAGAGPRAGRLAAARDRELGRRQRCSSTTATCPPDTWYDHDGKAFQPQIHYFVGGATKFYGAALYRMRERDFGELQHHGGISPAWPIGYDVFEPYYTQAEQLYQVHGDRGEDPTEPPASGPVPVPAGLARAAHPAAVRRHGQGRAAPVPLAVRDHARRGGPGVQRRASGARPATGSPAWSTPSPTPTSSRSGRRCSTTT